MKVIGVVGKNGSGKDEVLRYLKAKYNMPFIATGEMVREIASKEGLELTRENLGKVSERYFKELGKGCFVKLAAEKMQELGWEIGGISGIRSLDDVSLMKKDFGANFVLIRVYVSDPQVRYGRMTKRGEGRDPHSYEQFLRQDEEEEKIFAVGKAEELADYSVSNDGTLEDMHNEIDSLVTDKGLLTV